LFTKKRKAKKRVEIRHAPQREARIGEKDWGGGVMIAKENSKDIKGGATLPTGGRTAEF